MIASIHKYYKHIYFSRRTLIKHLREPVPTNYYLPQKECEAFKP